MERRSFLGAMVATAAGIIIPDWGQRVFPMYPRTRLIVPTQKLIELFHEGRLVDFVKLPESGSISPNRLRKILECRVGSIGAALELTKAHFPYHGAGEIEEGELNGDFDHYRPAPGWDVKIGDMEWTGGNHIKLMPGKSADTSWIKRSGGQVFMRTAR